MRQLRLDGWLWKIWVDCGRKVFRRGIAIDGGRGAVTNATITDAAAGGGIDIVAGA